MLDLCMCTHIHRSETCAYSIQQNEVTAGYHRMAPQNGKVGADSSQTMQVVYRSPISSLRTLPATEGNCLALRISVIGKLGPKRSAAQRHAWGDTWPAPQHAHSRLGTSLAMHANNVCVSHTHVLLCLVHVSLCLGCGVIGGNVSSVLQVLSLVLDLWHDTHTRARTHTYTYMQKHFTSPPQSSHRCQETSGPSQPAYQHHGNPCWERRWR